MSENVTKTVKGNPHMRVILIDNESTKIPGVLGISPEREKELDDIVANAWKEGATITDSMELLSKGLMHANELAFCTFHLGAHVGRTKAMQDKFEGLLGGLKGMLGKSDEE